MKKDEIIALIEAGEVMEKTFFTHRNVCLVGEKPITSAQFDAIVKHYYGTGKLNLSISAGGWTKHRYQLLKYKFNKKPQ